jgi:hypothetical protein
LVVLTTPPLTAAGSCRGYHRLIYQQEKEKDEEEMAIEEDQGPSPGMAAPSPTTTTRMALHYYYSFLLEVPEGRFQVQTCMDHPAG